MAYLRATRYGLVKVEPSEDLRESGWRKVWKHPSGALAMWHPWGGYWVVSMDGGYTVEQGWSSSLRAASGSIARRLRAVSLATA